MRFRWFAVPVLFALTAALGAQPDAPAPKAKDVPAEKRLGVRFDGTTVVKVPEVEGGKVTLVDRKKMKSKGGRKLSVPEYLAPNPPDTFDYTKANTLPFPILGNDQYGDCYYAAMCHMVQTWTGMSAAQQAAFDAAKVIARYRKLSGGDNGLSDYDVFGNSHNGEFYGGIVGPNGPHKILDHLIVSTSDTKAIALAMWAFGGLVYTAALCDEWVASGNSKPGATWDKGHANQGYGHAIILNGKNADGTYKLQTWGFNPPIRLTQAGLESSDPELIVCFSLEWFDPTTGKAANGLHYTELAALWKTLGGRDLPPNPFPGPAPTPPTPPNPPAPPNPPTPPVPGSGFTGALVYKDGVLVQVVPGGSAPSGVEADLKSAGLSPDVIADVLQLIADIKARKGLATYLADILKIAADLK